MKTVLKTIAAMLMVLCFAGMSANAATLIFDPDENDNWYSTGVRYGRGIELMCDEAGENKGNIYATCEYFYYLGRYGSEHFPIFESSDKGKSFHHVGDIYDTEFNQKKYLQAQDGTYYEVPLGTEGATTYYNEYWGMVFQPMLYELPEDVGQFKKGTALCAGSTHSGNHSAIVIYYSTDGLRTWKYLSTVTEGGHLAMNEGTAIWEGYLICEKGELYCFYSDEGGMTKGGGQRLVYKKTPDIINWSEDVKVCDFEEENPKFRPGMPIVTKLNDGRFMLVFEGVNMGGGYMPDFYKISDDIAVWDYKDHGTELPRIFAGGSPYCTTLKDGKIVITTHGTNKIGVNTNNLASNEWVLLDTEVESAYSRALFPMMSGELLITSGGPHAAIDPRKLTCDVQKIAIDDEVKIVSVSGTTPWGEEIPNYSNGAENVADNNPNSFFDGLSDGHVILDLGKEYDISAIGYTTRTNFSFRMMGGMFYGSNDKENWTKLYTVESPSKNGIINYAEIDGGRYRYIKYTSNGAEACNIAEIKVYSSDRLRVQMNSKPLNKGGEAIEKDGKILLPLRMIAEEMGADVAWVVNSDSAAVILKGKLAMIKIGSESYSFDGADKTASAKAILMDGSTYVPVDVIEDILQCRISISGKMVKIED